MLLTPEQMNAANEANIEILNNLSKHAFEGIEKLIELNVEVIRHFALGQMSNLKSSSETKDVQSLLSTQVQLIQPLTEKLTQYSQSLQDISYETQKAIIESSTENIQARNAKLQNLITEMTANLPTSSNAMVNSIKQAMANASQVYEASQKAIKQAVDISTHQTNVMADSAVKASKELSRIISK